MEQWCSMRLYRRLRVWGPFTKWTDHAVTYVCWLIAAWLDENERARFAVHFQEIGERVTRNGK